MARSPRALRYATPADMPAGMRAALEAAERARAQVVATCGLPTSLVRLDQPRQAALNALASHAITHAAQVGVDAIAGLKKKRGSKYGAVVTYVDGIRFDSKREANYYEALKLRKAAGEVLYFLRQVPIHLPGGTKLVVDFLIVEADGRIRYVDVKGRQTPVFRLKKREVEHHYPVEIELA